MSDNSTPELDKELEKTLEAEGSHIEPDEDKEEDKDEEASEDSEKDSEGDDTEDDSADDDSKDSDSDTDSDKKEEEEEEGEDDSEEEVKTPRKRPERYIPMKKYHSEKKEWETANETLKAEIKKLSKGDNTKEEDADAVEALSKEHDVNPELVAGILALAKKGMAIPKETQAVIDRAAQQNQEQDETTHFNKEWEGITPSISEDNPKATKPQIERAKKLMDKLSHIEKYADKDLDYIFFKERAQFKDIFVEGRRTAETSKTDSLNKTVKLSAKDFTGKDSKEKEKKFTDLIKLSASERSNIEKDMDPDTYMEWVTYVGQQDDGIVVSRGGRKVILK